MVLLDTHAWIWWINESPQIPIVASCLARKAPLVTRDDKITRWGLIPIYW